MKLRVVIDVDVSHTLAETMQRNGFNACPDGSALKIEIPNSPIIPKRKTKVAFIENPIESLGNIIDGSYVKLFDLVTKLSLSEKGSDKAELIAEAQQLLTTIK
jgi:hypothetical protein